MSKITPHESAEIKRKVNDHLKAADRLLKAGSFAEALVETEKALSLEPNNIYAQAFRKKIEDAAGTPPAPGLGHPAAPQSAPVAPTPMPSAPNIPEPPRSVAPPAAPVSAPAPAPVSPQMSAQERRRTFQRKLAAIMFTDMVNYSAITQKNELLAVQLLEAHRRILRPLFVQFDGEEIKTIGDAFLVEFVSVLQAVRCSIAIQNAISTHNRDAQEDRKIFLRIGVHIGDVIYQEEDIIGDGVNIASRIQSIAEAGGICISQDVYNQIRSQQDIHTEEIGEVALKGIIAPLRLYKVFTSDEAYRRIEEQAIHAAIAEGKKQAAKETLERCLKEAREAFDGGRPEEALLKVFAVQTLEPDNAEAKRIEDAIAEARKAALQDALEEARSIPREFFMEMHSRLLKRAWSDGALSSVERSLLDNIRGSFRISDADHQALEHTVQMEIYKERLAGLSANSSAEEREAVERLRKDFNITKEEHAALASQTGYGTSGTGTSNDSPVNTF